MTQTLSIEAPAKVNLFLRVLGKREDGYHEIETIFQAVDLADTVSVRPWDSGGVHLDVDGPDLGPASENLATLAAQAFLDEVGVSGSVLIRIEKRIPAGAGLGGGSSDAAAVLRLMNAMYGGPLADSSLLTLGSGLGSDVAFFLGGGPLAVGRGRGERLALLPALPAAHLVLALPPVHVATADAYAALSSRGLSTDGPRLGDPPASWAWIASLAHNDFQVDVAGRHEEVRAALGGLEAAGGRPVLLSGSGAACFGRFPHEAAAAANARALTDGLGFPCIAVRTLTSMPTLNRMGDSG